MAARPPAPREKRGHLLTAAFWSLAVQASPAVAADVAYGEYLASECATCHRRDGQDKGIPSIVGWRPEQFVAALVAYRKKDRPNPIMQTIAGRLSDEDMKALAAYYATLKPKP